MKLDPDLIKKILIAYEELPYGGNNGAVRLDGYSIDQIHYHQEILEEAGYIKAVISETMNGVSVIFPIRLTYQGHEFLGASRDDNAWEKTKSVFLKSGGFVMEVAKDLLIASLRNQLHLP